MIKKYYILLLLALLTAFAACNDDDLELRTGEVEYCIQAGWQNGRDVSSTRTLSNTDLLASGTSDININFSDYPSLINIHCSDGNDFVLTKGGRACPEHNTFWRYTPSKEYTIETIENRTLTFTASAVIDEDADPATADDGDRLQGTANKDNITANKHLQFTLHHTKALVRFAFKVAEKYDRIRYIKLKEVKLNDAVATFPAAKQALVLNASQDQLLCYLYIDPTKVTVSTSLTLACTYDIYDKDAVFDGSMSDAELAAHITRQDVTNRNTFSFQKIYTDAEKTQHVGSIQAGKYYDLFVTINPDYLYTLSDDDNKSNPLTIQ